jgi:hypothetical protein
VRSFQKADIRHWSAMNFLAFPFILWYSEKGLLI